MKRLVEASKKETGSQDVFFKVNPVDSQTATQKGDYLETGFYAVQTNAVSGSYTILPENAPKGLRIVNENGEEKSTLSINEKFKILIPKNTSSGNFKMKVKSTLTNLQAIAFKGSEKVQNTTVLLQRNSEKISTDLVVNWESVGSLKIMKLGEKKEVLKGAVFEVSNENFKQNVTTNDKGIAELGNLPIGIYSVKEIQAPAGYVLDGSVKKIEVKTGETAVLELKNENVKGELEITKVDVADGNTKLPNAEFTIYNEQGKEVVKGKTDEKGVAKFKLPYGKYTYKETIAPNGYVINEETFAFEIKENGQIIKHIVQDKKVEGELEITKVDIADGNTKLPNAEFTIYNEQGKEVVKGKTDEKGVAKFKLPYGKYTYKETIAPNGYVINEETFAFEIKENGQIIKHIVQDKKVEGELEITKVDIADGNTKLPNAEFTIYNEQGKEVVKGKTNEQGIAKFKLPYGKYTYKETIAPNGYVINEETFAFEIKENGEIIKHIVQDKKVEGELEITKVDVADGNTKLPNAEFTIYNEQGKEVVKGKTDEKGVAKFKLPYGKYTYKETIAPNGYVINEETFAFEIKEDGEIIKHIVKNKKEEKASLPFKPNKPTPNGEVKPSADVKPMQQPNTHNEVRLPATGGVGNEFTVLFVLGLGFIIAGAYVLKMKNRKEM
ncbi:collagen binding domain-containing protein [Bacillus cereus group sp. BfR-BA-01329]|uniref:collagen binding domain-containing protein n=1 Tax=Bacillus cereus group sp. BfR-BA-01329 TaxID=2920305 RepID=UPI0037C107E7